MTTDLRSEPALVTATLINLVVCDMLHQSEFSYAHFPELVDLAVIGTGLGVLRSNISLVNEKGTYWDSTRWDVAPRPFLDTQPMAYANAIAAWTRGQNNPAWANDLPSHVKSPMKKSLKFLFKTGDCFFNPESSQTSTLVHGQDLWWKLAAGKSSSSQVIAVRHLKTDAKLTDSQQGLLVDRLRSGNRDTVLHTVGSLDEMKQPGDLLVEELRLLAEHHDDEIRAKAIGSLTKMGALDEATVRVAARMLDTKVRHVAYSGLMALASIDSIPDSIMPTIDRSFAGALQSCDYEFVGLFAAAYQRWLVDPQAHFESLFADDSPEYLEVAQEVLQNVQQQLVSLGQRSA